MHHTPVQIPQRKLIFLSWFNNAVARYAGDYPRVDQFIPAGELEWYLLDLDYYREYIIKHLVVQDSGRYLYLYFAAPSLGKGKYLRLRLGRPAIFQAEDGSEHLCILIAGNKKFESCRNQRSVAYSAADSAEDLLSSDLFQALAQDDQELVTNLAAHLYQARVSLLQFLHDHPQLPYRTPPKAHSLRTRMQKHAERAQANKRAKASLSADNPEGHQPAQPTLTGIVMPTSVESAQESRSTQVAESTQVEESPQTKNSPQTREIAQTKDRVQALKHQQAHARPASETSTQAKAPTVSGLTVSTLLKQLSSQYVNQTPATLFRSYRPVKPEIVPTQPTNVVEDLLWHADETGAETILAHMALVAQIFPHLRELVSPYKFGNSANPRPSPQVKAQAQAATEEYLHQKLFGQVHLGDNLYLPLALESSLAQVPSKETSPLALLAALGKQTRSQEYVFIKTPLEFAKPLVSQSQAPVDGANFVFAGTLANFLHISPARNASNPSESLPAGRLGSLRQRFKPAVTSSEPLTHQSAPASNSVVPAAVFGDQKQKPTSHQLVGTNDDNLSRAQSLSQADFVIANVSNYADLFKLKEDDYDDEDHYFNDYDKSLASLRKQGNLSQAKTASANTQAKTTSRNLQTQTSPKSFQSVANAQSRQAAPSNLSDSRALTRSPFADIQDLSAILHDTILVSQLGSGLVHPQADIPSPRKHLTHSPGARYQQGQKERSRFAASGLERLGQILPETLDPFSQVFHQVNQKQRAHKRVRFRDFHDAGTLQALVPTAVAAQAATPAPEPSEPFHTQQALAQARQRLKHDKRYYQKTGIEPKLASRSNSNRFTAIQEVSIAHFLSDDLGGKGLKPTPPPAHYLVSPAFDLGLEAKKVSPEPQASTASNQVGAGAEKFLRRQQGTKAQRLNDPLANCTQTYNYLTYIAELAQKKHADKLAGFGKETLVRGFGSLGAGKRARDFTGKSLQKQMLAFFSRLTKSA